VKRHNDYDCRLFSISKQMSSICRVRLRNTSNALTLQMSSKQIRLQVPPKLFEVNSWIAQMIRKWIPDC